jgi:YesN/AraC family two-component response regulator
MYVIKSGELYIREGNSDYLLKKGDAFLLEPNIEHTGYKEAACHYYYIHFKHNGISKIIDKTYKEISNELIEKRKLSLTSDIYSEVIPTSSIYYLPKYYHYENSSELLSILAEAEYDFYQRYENYKTITSLRFLELLIKICRNYTTTKIEKTESQFSKSFIKARDIVNFISCSYSKKITTAEIEEKFESNYDYLNRVFHKMTGYTIINYINLMRINNAKELISNTTLKFTEIAYLVGIEDPYYFSKLFKKITGMSPSKYAKECYDTIRPK